MSCLIIESFGQSFNLDRETSTEDHWAVWNDNSKPDTSRLNAIHNYIWFKYLLVQPDSAFIITNKQIEFARLKGSKSGEADGLNLKGNSFVIRGNSEEAIRYYDSSLTIYLAIDNKAGIAKTLNNLGISYSRLGDNFKALNFLNRSLVLAEQTGDKNAETNCLNNIGILYSGLMKLDKALDFYQRAHALSKELNVEDEIMLINIGVIYEQQGKVEDAIKTYSKALKLAKGNNNLINVSLIQFNKGIISLNLKDTAAALVNLRKSLKNYEKLGNMIGSVSPLVYMGEIFHNRGIIDSAEVYSVRAFERGDKTHSLESFIRAVGFRYKILKQKGDHEQALQLHEILTSAKDSLKNDKVNSELLRQEYKHKFDEQVLEETNRRRMERYVILFSVFLFIIVAGSILMRRYTKQMEQQSQLLHEIELLKERNLVKVLTTEETKDTSVGLNKSKIQASIDGKLNDSDWKILNVIYKDPILVTTAIAELVSLSPAGIKSSFNKMYRLFDIPGSNNKKLALIMRVVELSNI